MIKELIDFVDRFESGFLGFLTGVSISLFAKNLTLGFLATLSCVLLIFKRVGGIWIKKKNYINKMKGGERNEKQ